MAVLMDVDYEWRQAQHEINRLGIAFDRRIDYEYVAILKVASTTEVEEGATGAAQAVREGILL